ncbi:MotA/TolQ/ExbB proton channel family protein [Salipiger sp. IMCC34102]|uniref:MotA/TolQ/ExbB proton channel family protein n=1 Tax=Salipiger sp. IMCC34102 TaxID=2510647 RepID=UPI00101B6735|nr:MotA/TolQ/ExbB proton channel family protein [Salipiger sp. IMCC34102]RYH04473.1 MotA/TolQ/ExbB proton channel family protein [Salipiger sp. IMCC34102]
MTGILNGLAGILDLGGPVVLILAGLSIVSLALVLYKLWQHALARVGRHRRLRAALDAHDAGHRAEALRLSDESRSHFAPLVGAALRAPQDAELHDRLMAESEADLARLEGGYRLLDSIAQISPLLGLFGTVLGMIDAFQALQQAGSSVDPSLLAGGIWVALLTTAAGLAVAMPTSLALTWLESRTARERDFADLAFARVRKSRTQPADPVGVAGQSPAHV